MKPTGSRWPFLLLGKGNHTKTVEIRSYKVFHVHKETQLFPRLFTYNHFSSIKSTINGCSDCVTRRSALSFCIYCVNLDEFNLKKVKTLFIFNFLRGFCSSLHSGTCMFLLPRRHLDIDLQLKEDRRRSHRTCADEELGLSNT